MCDINPEPTQPVEQVPVSTQYTAPSALPLEQPHVRQLCCLAAC